MYFDELDLNDYVLDALDDMQFETCTPIQESCIPHILAGRDILGVAQTGTGKTAAYLLPILSKLADGGYPADAINCVIMSPTRELAQQIDQAMQGFAYHLDGVSSVAVYGGNDGNRYDQELKSLSLGADVVIATPGRFISHMSLGNVDLSRVSFFILDEADRMLDMGFSEDILTIARKLPQNVQTIMFSATMPDKIEDLAKTLLKNPVEVKLAVSKPAEKIQQKAYVCYETQKMAILKDIFKAGDLNRVIIFSGSKQKVKQIAASLKRMKVNCGEMHSDLDQAERDEMMFQFKSGQLDVIVATDIISRGIDIDDIAMVVNFDVPRDAEDYVHRIGRTARANRDGVAITLVSEQDQYYFQQIEKFLEKTVEKVPLPEDVGEAPEYSQSARPAKGKSAKSRRREARDQQSHKDKKSRNRQNKQRAEKAAKPQPREADKADQSVAKDGQHQAQPQDQQPREKQPRRGRQRREPRELREARDQQPQQQGDASRDQKAPKERKDQKERRSRGRGRGKDKSTEGGGQQGGQQGGQKGSQQGGQQAQSQADAPKGKKKSSRKRGRGRGKQGGDQAPVHSTKYDIREDYALPQKNKDSKLSELVKKPLKWLHIIK